MSDVVFDESVILMNVEAENDEEVLKKIGGNLVDKGLVKDSFVPAIVEREKEYPTGLPTAGVSVAIPHTDVEHVNQKAISVALLDRPVDFHVMGDDAETTPVRIVFMLAMNESHAQLSLLQKLMQIFQDEGLLKKMIEEKDKQQIQKMVSSRLDLDSIEGGEK